MQWNLSTVDTIGTSKKCLLQRGVHFLEVLLKSALLLQIPALKCIGTAHPYGPIEMPLLKLVKSMDQKQCVIATTCAGFLQGLFSCFILFFKDFPGFLLFSCFLAFGLGFFYFQEKVLTFRYFPTQGFYRSWETWKTLKNQPILSKSGKGQGKNSGIDESQGFFYAEGCVQILSFIFKND